MATLRASGERNNVTLVEVTVTVVQSYRRLATKDDDQLPLPWWKWYTN